MAPSEYLSNPSAADAEPRGFEKAVLRLVKGGPERQAIEAGQIDAIIDPASGGAILLPQAQRVLTERKARFCSLVGLSSDWHWVQDEHFRFVSHASAAGQSSGFRDQEIIGKTLWELSIDNLGAADWCAHRQQLEWHLTFRDLEVRYTDSDGNVCSLSVSGEPNFDERNQFKGYCGIMRDVTKHKQSDAAVLEPNRFARAALDALAGPVCVLDRVGAVLWANRAWRISANTRAGIEAGACEGANYLSACDHAWGDERVDGVAVAAAIRQVLAGERSLFRYDRTCGPTTRRRWFTINIAGVGGETEARAVVSIEDVSERKRSELLQGLELQVARCLAEAEGSHVALQAVIRLVCEAQCWDCGRYFLLDKVAGVLCFEQAWGIADAAVEQFLEQSRGLVFRPDAGLAGRVLQTGQPLWILDGTRDADRSSKALSPERGEDGAFVFPVISEYQTVGVLAFSSRTIGEPNDRMLQAVRSIGEQLGGFLRRQQAVDALRRSESRFRSLTGFASDWYWELDCDLRLTQFVGSGIAGSGDLIGKSYWELPNVVHDDVAWGRHRAQLAVRWDFCDFEFATDHPDGEHGYYCISGGPIYDDAGTFGGYRGIGVDITVRKHAEIALYESESRLRASAGHKPMES